jgi:hypothetical protein
MRELTSKQKEYFEDLPDDIPSLFSSDLDKLLTFWPFKDWTITELVGLFELKIKEAKAKA